jgi:asparagine synthase (glutamine-hydrolysing)
LPAQIVNRRSKGGMEEHVKQVLLDNLDFVRGMLLDGQLAARGLLDRKRVAAFLSGSAPAQGAPIGLFHSLVAVEAWLSRWAR